MALTTEVKHNYEFVLKNLLAGGNYSFLLVINLIYLRMNLGCCGI